MKEGFDFHGDLQFMGNGTAGGGRLACNEKISGGFEPHILQKFRGRIAGCEATFG